MAYEATPARRAQSRLRATPRRFAPPCACSSRPALRCSSWRSSPPSPSVLRAAGWRGRTPASSTLRTLTHALADPLLAPLARWDCRLVPANRRLGLRRERAAGRLLPALPAAGAGACHPVRRPREAALLVAAYAVSLAAFLAALCAPATGSSELELGRRLARPTLLLLAVFPAALYFGAPYSESLFLLLCGGRLLRGADRAAGPGPARAPGRVGHAQRRAPAPAAAGDALVELASATAARRRVAPARARSGSPPTRPGWASWRATPCASSTSRRRGRAS